MIQHFDEPKNEIKYALLLGATMHCILGGMKVYWLWWDGSEIKTTPQAIDFLMTKEHDHKTNELKDAAKFDSEEELWQHFEERCDVALVKGGCAIRVYKIETNLSVEKHISRYSDLKI